MVKIFLVIAIYNLLSITEYLPIPLQILLRKWKLILEGQTSAYWTKYRTLARGQPMRGGEQPVRISIESRPKIAWRWSYSTCLEEEDDSRPNWLLWITYWQFVEAKKDFSRSKIRSKWCPAFLRNETNSYRYDSRILLATQSNLLCLDASPGNNGPFHSIDETNRNRQNYNTCSRYIHKWRSEDSYIRYMYIGCWMMMMGWFIG